MKISIQNFKSIEKLENFELKPLTILSGNNSSGKSSFLQLLLILKQTLAISSSNSKLFIKGDYYKAKAQTDLIFRKDLSKELVIKFEIDKAEFARYGELIQESIYDGFPNYTCTLTLVFKFLGSELTIKQFKIEYTTEIKTDYFNFINGEFEKDFSIDTNNILYFLTSDSIEESPDIVREIRKVNYSSFFPISYEETVRILNGMYKRKKASYDSKNLITRFNTGSIKSFLEAFANELYYIGPLRAEPQDNYAGEPEKNWVGIQGEYTAQLLEASQDKKISCFLPTFSESGEVKFRKKNLSLLAAVNFWMCKVFKLAKQLTVKESGDSYSIFLTSDNGITTTVKHVGFGISQILPIVVQGLLMDSDATLILEQPEIHLHPKVQSYLLDFLYSLTFQGKKFIVETHSDHLITRLRRRIAEDESSELLKKVNLTFIENKMSGLTFKNIQLDEYGVYDVFPDDFIENPEKELMALLNAQMNKRKSKRK